MSLGPDVGGTPSSSSTRSSLSAAPMPPRSSPSRTGPLWTGRGARVAPAPMAEVIAAYLADLDTRLNMGEQSPRPSSTIASGPRPSPRGGARSGSDRLSAQHVARWRAECAEDIAAGDMKPKTFNNHHAPGNAILAWAREGGYLRHDPLGGGPSGSRSRRPTDGSRSATSSSRTNCRPCWRRSRRLRRAPSSIWGFSAACGGARSSLCGGATSSRAKIAPPAGSTSGGLSRPARSLARKPGTRFGRWTPPPTCSLSPPGTTSRTRPAPRVEPARRLRGLRLRDGGGQAGGPGPLGPEQLGASYASGRACGRRSA